MLKGYYHIGLTDNAENICILFITPFGIYDYTVIPPEMCNASATFNEQSVIPIRGLKVLILT